MNSDPLLPQLTLDNVGKFAVDPARGQLLVVRDWKEISLVAASGESVELPALTIPESFLRETQARGLLSLPSLVDVALHEDSAVALTSEGVWVCDLRERTAWSRVAGHPTDPPAGVPYDELRRRRFPAALRADKEGVRRGSKPVVVAAHGNTVVGATWTVGLPVLSDYKLELNTWNRSDGSTTPLSSTSKKQVAHLAVSDDGKVVAFSEELDFRVVFPDKKRATWCRHDKKIRLRSLHLSSDGEFALACGAYLNDFRGDAPRGFLWNTRRRELVLEQKGVLALGFIGQGDGVRAVWAQLDDPTFPHRRRHPGVVEFISPSDPRGEGAVKHRLESEVTQVRGNLALHAVLTRTRQLLVFTES